MKYLLIIISTILISCNNKHHSIAQKEVLLIESNSAFTTPNPSGWEIPNGNQTKVFMIQYGWVPYYSEGVNSIFFIDDTSGPGMGSSAFATESEMATFAEVMGNPDILYPLILFEGESNNLTRAATGPFNSKSVIRLMTKTGDIIVDTIWK